MKKLNNPTENFVSKRINQRRVRCWVALLSALVLFLTVNTLKLEADTLERIATCGIEQHVHDESCYDASGALICGLAEHAHTDACFQQRPQRHDLTRVDGFMPLNAKVTLATPMPKLTSNSADGQDAVQAEADYYSDIPTEVGSGIEPPVDEIETELAGEDAAPAVEDAVPLEIVYEDQAEETVQQPEYVINGSTVLLSDILSVLGMKASGIQTVGELEGDTFAEDPVNFAVEATQNDYELRVLRDFDAAELGVMTDDEVIIITLKNGIAPVEDNDDENPSENDDINIEETHTGETDDEAAADETVDEETEDSADEATEETVDELTEDTDDEETEEAADEMTVDATEEETVETVEETETAAVVPDKLVALDFADYDCLADATVYFYAPDRGAVLVNAEELAEADGVHLTVNAPVVLSMEADLGLADLGLAELEAALEEAPEDIDVRIGENPVLFENGVLIISGDGELTVNGVTYTVTNLTLPARSVESDNIIISTVDDQATLLGVTPAFEDNGEDEGDIYALFAAQMDENIVTATSEEIQVDAIEPAKGLLRSSAMMATTDAAPEAEEAVADAEETAGTETTEAAVETRTLRVRVYDVSLIREGESVEPDAPIHVETTFDAPLEGENFQLYHIVDGKPEEVDGFVKTDDQGRAIGMSFDTASLSPFAVVYYTVEYATTDKEIDVTVDFKEIVINGVDYDKETIISALNDGVAVNIDELEKGYGENGEAIQEFVAYSTADNKVVETLSGWAAMEATATEGLSVVNGQIKVTKDGTVTLTDGETTIVITIVNYTRLLAENVAGEGVSIDVLEGEVPAGSVATYTERSEEETVALIDNYENIPTADSVGAFDVSIAMPEGDVYTGEGQFKVTVDAPEVPEGGKLNLFHIHDGEAKQIEAEIVDGKLTFVTPSFSDFVYTVDFHFAGGDFSIVGGSGVYFSVIANELNLYGKVEGFAMDKIQDMVFSNPQLVSVKRVVDDSGAVNWLLRSLQPFNSEETLTLYMIDNSVLVIDVTDDQTGLASFITDARIVIDGTTYGPGDTWPAYEDVDYNLTLSFSERGSRQFPKGGESISMDLPYGMTIPEGTNGTFTIEAGLAGNVTGNSYRVENGKLIITFGSDPSDILTRSSNVHFDLNFVCQITEQVQKIKFTDGVEGNIDLKDGADVTVNKTGSYNETTGQMDYTVTLSSKGNSSNVHVNDVISGNKLTLDQSSIVINPSKELVGSIAKSNTGFDLTIKELANGETVTIKYSANIDMSGIGPDFKIVDAATNGKNTVNVENDDNHNDSSEFIYDNVIKYSNIRKVNSTVEDGTGDDAGKKILTWKIVANDNYRGSIVGGTITDKIDWNSAAAMKYVTGADGKVALSIVAKNPDGTPAYTWSDTVTIDANGDQQSWTYTIPQKGSANEILSYEITYQTVVDPSSLPAYNNGTVKNDTTNDHGGSTSGTGFVGGGGDEPGDETTITATKTAKTVTSEYIDWDIVVVIPAEGYDTFEIVDDLPLSNGQPNGADMPYGDPIVSGLVEGEESYKTEIIELVGQDAQWIKRDGENLTAYRMKLTFYKDQAKTQTGLKNTGSQRLLTVTIRTKNDPVWLEQGNGQTHTNNAKINGYQVSATAKPVRSTVTKKVKKADYLIDGMPAYYYEVVLTNVTSDTVELDDYFDGNHLAFGDSTLLVGGGGSYDMNSQYILYWGENDYDQNRDMGSGTYNLPKFTIPEAGHLHIKVENIPKTAQGAYYPYYIVRYVLKVKDQNALDDIKEKAIKNKGKFEIANSAFWGTTGDEVTIDYEVSGLDKDGWFRNSIDGVYNPNERLYDFVIDVNPQSLPLNGGEDMEISDTHTDNLSVQYQSVKAYKVTGDVTKDAFKTAIQNYLKTHEDATGFTMDGIAPATEISWNFTGNIGTFSGIHDQTHYLIYYSSLITGSNQQNFSNEAEMEGFIDTQSSTRTYGSSGSGAATVYQIGLLKYKDGKTSEGLQGAKFQLFRGNNKEPMTYGDTAYTRAHNLVGKNITFTTGADGYVRIALNQTEHGAELEEDVQYWLKEIESPAGYKIDSSVEYWKFKLTTDPDEVNYGEGGEYIYFYYDDIMKMSNTPTNEPLTVKVDKLWLGLDGELMTDEQKENLTATVQLYKKTNAGEYEAVTGKIQNQGGTQTFDGIVVLNKDNNWTYTWNNLPRVDGQGNKYAYKLEEIAGPNTEDIYASSVALTEDETNKHYEITNQKVEQRDVDVSVSKTWLDREGNPLTVADAPDYIRFYLYRVVSKEPFKVAPTSGGNPYDAGTEYSDYLVTGTAANTGLYELTKTNSSNYANGLTFKNLPSIVVDRNNNDATFYAYYVKEVPVDGYAPSAEVTTTTDTTGGTTKYKTTVALTNQKLPEPIDLTVRKAWKDDAGETMSSKPSDITFHLYQVASTTPFSADPTTWPTSGGSLYTVASHGNAVVESNVQVEGTYKLYTWSSPYYAVFGDLPANSVDAKGKVTYYAYYVDEVEVDGYDASYATTLDSETGAYTITMTNQQTPKYTSITADKTWLDKDGGPNLLAEKTDADEVTLDVYRIEGTSLPVGSVIINGQEQEISSLKTITIVSRGGAILANSKVIARDGDKLRVVLKLNGDDVSKWNGIYVGYGTDQNANTVKLVEDQTGAESTYTQDITVDSNVVYIMAGPGWTNNVTSTLTVENTSISSIQYKLTQAQAAGISGATSAGTLTLNKSNGWTDSLNNLLAESRGTKYTYFVVERGGSEYQAEYVYDGTTVHVTNREKDMLEVDKKWLNASGEDYTVAKTTGEVTYTLYQSATEIPNVSIDYSQLMYGHSDWTDIASAANSSTNAVGGSFTATIPESIPVGAKLRIEFSIPESYQSGNNPFTGLNVEGGTLSGPTVTDDSGTKGIYLVNNVGSSLILKGTLLCDQYKHVNMVVTIVESGSSTSSSSAESVIESLGTITIGYDSIKSTTLPSSYTVAAGKTPWSALIGNLPTTDGTNNFKYYVEETAVTGFNTIGDGAANVVSADGTITITNQKTPTGSLKIKKELEGLTFGDLTSEQQEALNKITFTVTNTNGYNATLTLAEAMRGKTLSDLTPGSYTVTETRPDDSTPSGYTHTKTTVQVNSGVTTEAVATNVTVAANQETYVVFVNTYTASTTDLTVTKILTKANASGSDLTFYVGLFTDANGTNLATPANVGGVNPQPITVEQNASSGTVTFSGLTVGTTYYVFETNASGVKVSTEDKTSGYAIQASDEAGKSVTLQPSGNTASITNEYDASGSVTFTQKKTFTNGAQDTEFGYTITEYTNDEYSATKGDALTGTMTDAADGVTTVSYTMDDVGDHYYIVKENLPAGANPTDDDKNNGYIIVEGVKYDLTEYKYTVNVSDSGAGTLVVKKDSAEVANIDSTFTNERLGSLKFTKYVDGIDVGNADDISFTITGPNDYSKTFKWSEMLTYSEMEEKGSGNDDGVNYRYGTLKNLPQGNYTVTETVRNAKNGYYKVVTTYTVGTGAASEGTATDVSVVGGETAEVSFTNTYTELRDYAVQKRWIKDNVTDSTKLDCNYSGVTSTHFNLYRQAGDIVEYVGTYELNSSEKKTYSAKAATDTISGTSSSTYNDVPAKWFTVINDLPVKNASGLTYEYFVIESLSDGNIVYNNTTYTAADSVTVINKNTPSAERSSTLVFTEAYCPEYGNTVQAIKNWLVHIQAEKVWDDDATEHPAITLHLNKSVGGADPVSMGTAYDKTIDANATGNDLKVDWGYLPAYDYATGEKIEYSVTEDAVEGYGTTIEKDTEKSSDTEVKYVFKVTNSKSKTSIEATKVWKSGDQAITWPEDVASVTFALYVKVGETAVPITDNSVKDSFTGIDSTKNVTAENKTASWSELPRKVNGVVAEYSVVETKVTLTDDTVLEGTALTTAYNPSVAGYTVTNNIPKTEISGTKTWSTAKAFTNPTLTLTRKSSKDGATDETVSATPSWTGEGNTRTYTFSGLDQYDNDGYKYTYAVAETQFTITVDSTTYTYTVANDGTVTSTPDGAPKFVYSGEENNFTNKEVTEATVTKTWAESIDEAKIGSITYLLTRKIGETVDTTFSQEVTINKDDAGRNDWNKTWSDLDAYGTITPAGGTAVSGAFTYVAEEIGFVYDRVTYTVDPTTHVVSSSDANAHKFWKVTKNGTAFTNTLDETYLDVVKEWSLNGGDPTYDTDDELATGIQFYLWRKSGDNAGELVDSVTKAGKTAKKDAEHTDGAEPFTITRTGTKGSGKWELHIDGLEKTDASGNAYTYWIQEVTVPGYSTTPTIKLANGTDVNSTSNAPAESTVVITNSKFTVSLPSTGGTGTTIFYAGGISLMLFAFLGFVLTSRKRSRGEGI